AFNWYKLEIKTPLIQAPTLVLAGSADPFSYPKIKPLAENIKNCRTTILAGGMVPMVDQMPEEFSRVVIDFLKE
ncbi:MAG: alpha/beta fold hydrolase, partial [Desulfobacterales bacterium]